MSVSVVLRAPCGTTYCLDVMGSDTGYSVTAKVAEVLDVSAECIGLVYEGEAWGRGDSVGEVGIVADTVIDVVVDKYAEAVRIVQGKGGLGRALDILCSSPLDEALYQSIVLVAARADDQETIIRRLAVYAMLSSSPSAVFVPLQDSHLHALINMPCVCGEAVARRSVECLAYILDHFGGSELRTPDVLIRVSFLREVELPTLRLLVTRAGASMSAAPPLHWTTNYGTIPHNAGYTIATGLLQYTRIHHTLLVFLLEGGHIDLTVQTPRGLVPLHCAARGPSSDAIPILIDHGADPAALDCKHRTVLHHLMIAHGRRLADLPCMLRHLASERDVGGRTALYYLLRHGANEENISILLRHFYSADSGMYDKADRRGNTLLHACMVNRRRPSVMHYLLRHAKGVLVPAAFSTLLNQENHNKLTPVDFACRHHHPDSLDSLLMHSPTVTAHTLQHAGAGGSRGCMLRLVACLPRSVVLRALAAVPPMPRPSAAYIYNMLPPERTDTDPLRTPV